MFLYLYKLGLKSITRDIAIFSPEVCSFRITYHGSSCVSPLHISELSSQEMNDGARLGIDSHADITCAGKHVKIMEVIHGKSCTVHPFNDSYKPMENISIINGVTAVDTSNGETYILELNHAMDFTRTMTNSLLCPNQARHNNVIINDVPRCYDSKSEFNICFPDSDVKLPLERYGPTACLNTRYPTNFELENCQYLQLTSLDEWNPYHEDENIAISDVSAFHFDFEKDTDNFLDSDLYLRLLDSVNVGAINHTSSRSMTPENLSKLWNIPIKSASKTLDATTQHHIKTINNGKIHRRSRTEPHQRQYRQLGGPYSRFSSDTLFSKIKSTRSNVCAQLFSNHVNFNKIYPLKTKGEAPSALSTFIHEVGIPTSLHTDGAKELRKGEWGKICRKRHIHQTETEPHSPWQNPSEYSIGTIKRHSRQILRRTLCPIRLWDYCFEYTAEIRSLTVTDLFQLNNRTPYEIVMGYTPDISEFLNFGFYDWIWYWEGTSSQKEDLGRWLGAAHSVGQGLAYYVLKDNGQVVVRNTFTPLTKDDYTKPENKVLMNEHTKNVYATIGNYKSHIVQGEEINDDDPYSDIFIDDDSEDDENIEFQEIDENGK